MTPSWTGSGTSCVADARTAKSGMLARYLIAGALLLCLPVSANARVTSAGAGGFVSEHELLITATPDAVFTALTRDVGKWWNPDHSYSGKAENFYLEAHAQGCFCERLDDGGVVVHMQVFQVRPGSFLRLIGGLGPLQGMGATGSMDFALERSDTGTVLTYRYSVSGYLAEGLDTMAAIVDEVQLGQLMRLKSYLNR